ncbi:MAG: hypothetical protein VX335_00085, partial [Pseudomonadota bacterium]|nr:hypothetical protein [Pseudomonadota bacterium]
YYVPTYKNSCIIESICHWFNQNESIPYQLDIEEIQSLKHDITRKWEAITGGIYNYGASPGATKMPHFDEFMLLSQTKSGYYEEFQYNICCNFIYLAEKEFGVKCSNNLLLKSPRKEPNKRLNQSLLATCCSLGLLVCYLLSPSNATKIMTAGILGKLPLINSLPILQIVIISVLLHTSINIFIETVNIENKTSKKSALKYTFIFIVSLAIITLISFILPSFSIIISQLLPWQAINVSGVPLLQAGIISLVISLISFVVNNIGGNGLKIPPSGVNNNVIDLKSDELKHDTSSNLTANHILNNTNTSNTEIQSAQGLRFGN